jgi:hypothetical protein
VRFRLDTNALSNIAAVRSLFVKPNIHTMKHILTILATLSLALGSSFAGCGKIDTDKGKLKAFNTEAKSITIEVGGKDVKRTLTPSSKGADDLKKLEGKDVVVTSSHGKVESITKG